MSKEELAFRAFELHEERDKLLHKKTHSWLIVISYLLVAAIFYALGSGAL